MMFEAVERAIDAVRRGEFVVVVDDEDRENEGDLIIAAEKMTPDKMAFMIRYTSGVICLPLEGDRLDQLELPRSPSRSTPRPGPPPASPRPTAARPCWR
jgi:3,4-dihydroxy 2-butanone 4-phosphate synthase/GTP cyclohydrolase II